MNPHRIIGDIFDLGSRLVFTLIHPHPINLEPDSVNNNLGLDTECGINRVAIRSTATPSKITLTATREYLEPAKVVVESKQQRSSVAKMSINFHRPSAIWLR
jgi:hypothetical protein